MALRIAAIMGLLAFALCLVVGGVQAGNPFDTTVLRALAAMGGTFAVGLVVGGMAQKMLDENTRVEQEKLEKTETEPGPADR